MLKQVVLKFGPGGPSSTLAFSPATMTVFVGPNGSGKSFTLRELQGYLENGPTMVWRTIDAVSVDIPEEATVRHLVRSRTVPYPPGTAQPAGQIRILKPVPGTGGAAAWHIDEEGLVSQIIRARGQQSVPQPAALYSAFVNLFTVALDGRTRLALVDQRGAGDLLGPPENHLVALFQNGSARRRVREIIADALGLYFVIDPTNLGNLRVRLSSRPPVDDAEEQALDERARDFHANAPMISEFSDGVKAFTGLVSALVSSDFRVMIIDEPDAFLHPPLARTLGLRATALAAERSANIFAATHSAEFLMGCIESGRPLNIVRLTYESDRPTARILPAAEVTQLMRDPLLRSTNVLSALFHRGAVVCEADRDRSFYQEINTRLLAKDSSGVRDTVFLQAQNKQTIRRIVGPLRSMGIPAAAVVDVDIIKGIDLKDLLSACAVPRDLAHALTVLRGNVEARFDSLGHDMKKGGLSLLTGSHAESCRSLLSQLAQYGIFVVPNGEVESWLPGLGIQASKAEWLSKIFEAMGSDPGTPSYVGPSADDVWAFVRDIAKWIHNPTRSGMPTS